MGDKSPNNFKKKLKQIVQREQKDIDSGVIPAHVTRIGNTLGGHGKDGNYRLIFKYYNHRQCELASIREFKPLIDKFNYVSQSDFRDLRIKGPVHNNGDYSNLFKDLPADIDVLEEIAFGDVERIIFFRIHYFFCIVAVLNEHRRT